MLTKLDSEALLREEASSGLTQLPSSEGLCAIEGITLPRASCSSISLLSGLHSGLNDLERISCLRVMVLVWVELNRQFAVKLGQLVGLHL